MIRGLLSTYHESKEYPLGFNLIERLFMSTLKIAFVGQKGIPATFGGVEYHVKELSERLAKRGHDQEENFSNRSLAGMSMTFLFCRKGDIITLH